MPSLRSLASELNRRAARWRRRTRCSSAKATCWHGAPPAPACRPPRHGATAALAQRQAGAPRAPARDASRAAALPARPAGARRLPAQALGAPGGRRLRELGGSADGAGRGRPWPAAGKPGGYLGISRGIHCRPEQVFITAGHSASLALVQRALMTPGDAIWLEDPGYLHARQLLQGLGVRCVPVPVDGEGLVVEAGQRLAPDARFALVTPTHRAPPGSPLAARRPLLERAQRVGMGAGGRLRQRVPLPGPPAAGSRAWTARAGCSMPAPSARCSTGLRLAYLVVPERRWSASARSPRSSAAVAASCCRPRRRTSSTRGHFARHLKKMRSLYARRRAHTCGRCWRSAGAPGYRPAGRRHAPAGPPRCGERRSPHRRACPGGGLAVIALSPWYLGDGGAPGLLLGFTNVATAEEARGWQEGCGRCWRIAGGPLGRWANEFAPTGDRASCG